MRDIPQSKLRHTCLCSRLLAGTVVITWCLLTSGCGPLGNGSNSTITTTQSYNVQVGGSTVQQADPTAFAAIDVTNSANEQGCFADGGLQPPPSIPPGSSSPLPSSMGSSPKVGQCVFSPYTWPASWEFDFFSGQCQVAGQTFDSGPVFVDITNGNYSVPPICTIADSAAPAADNHFALSTSLPASVTISAPGLTTSFGMPQLLVFDRALALVDTVTASSVASGGTAATFPFPTNLTGGLYMFAVKNFPASGKYKVVDATHFSVGGANSVAGVFGVDAAEITTTRRTCRFTTKGTFCDTSTGRRPTAIFTQYFSNQVSYGSAISVGSEPVAVKFFGSHSSTTSSGTSSSSISTTTAGPANAVVVNMGSSSVSIVDLVTLTRIKDISVGTQPMSVAINSAGTDAYVPTYGSGILYEINLSTQSVSRTVSIATGIQSVAIDPSGNDVWVGGANELFEVSLSSFTVVNTVAMNGNVTSLAASNAQNKLAFTLVQNCCSSSSSYTASDFSIASSTPTAKYSTGSADALSTFTMGGTLPAASLPQATAVSVKFSNGMAASSTPTGFVIYDIVSGKTIMSGNTPTPVRGIASDPDNTIVYFTLPDRNEYLSVPLPF